MDSSELLRLQLSKQLECTRNGICIGPTGLTGPAGPTGPTGPAGTNVSPKTFTFYLDYSGPNALSRIYIPPGFCEGYPDGIILTDDDSVNGISFKSTTNITFSSTIYAVPNTLNATGYVYSTGGGYWSPTASSYIGGGNLTWQNTADYTLNLNGVTAGRINGGNTGTRPTTGVLTGWLGTLTISYL
jgi:hypothetical protein